jgi:hypothetical protein
VPAHSKHIVIWKSLARKTPQEEHSKQSSTTSNRELACVHYCNYLVEEAVRNLKTEREIHKQEVIKKTTNGTQTKSFIDLFI